MNMNNEIVDTLRAWGWFIELDEEEGILTVWHPQLWATMVILTESMDLPPADP